MEVRAKMPSGDWLWPAIWYIRPLLPSLTIFQGFSPPTTHMVNGQLAVKSIYANREEIHLATLLAASISLARLFTGDLPVPPICGR